jgi:chaperonin cofactor prefoldin
MNRSEDANLLRAIVEGLAQIERLVERLDQRIELLQGDQRQANEKLARLRLFLDKKLP